MFTTERIPAYLNNFSGAGNGEEKQIKISIYVTSITFALAKEVSPYLADRLFRNTNGNGDWQPAQEMPKASFSSITVPKQNLIFNALEDPTIIDDGVMIPNAQIANLRAQRAYPDKPDFRLEFDCVMPMDDNTMKLVHRYYKNAFFLTTTTVQLEMFEEPKVDGVQTCHHCNDRATWQDSEKNFLCQKHLRLGVGDVRLIVKLETPKEVEERLKRETETKRSDAETNSESSKTPSAESETEDDKVETGSFINDRNRRGQSRRGK